MTILLASIASVSLIVGGIGIMNIMLVSVTERTREIGLRLAVGAAESDVQMQFLGEATVLSALGGGIGVLIGILASNIISSTLRWPTLIPWGALVIGGDFLCRSRSFLRLLSGSQSRTSRSYRGAALRVTIRNGLIMKMTRSFWPGMVLGIAALALSAQPANDLDTSGEFFIISSVDLNKKQILLKLPTEVTALMRVDADTRYFEEDGKAMKLTDLRAGDTAYITSKGSVGQTVAIRIRKGPMTLEILRQRYLGSKK